MNKYNQNSSLIPDYVTLQEIFKIYDYKNDKYLDYELFKYFLNYSNLNENLIKALYRYYKGYSKIYFEDFYQKILEFSHKHNKNLSKMDSVNYKNYKEKENAEINIKDLSERLDNISEGQVKQSSSKSPIKKKIDDLIISSGFNTGIDKDKLESQLKSFIKKSPKDLEQVITEIYDSKNTARAKTYEYFPTSKDYLYDLFNNLYGKTSKTSNVPINKKYMTNDQIEFENYKLFSKYNKHITFNNKYFDESISENTKTPISHTPKVQRCYFDYKFPSYNPFNKINSFYDKKYDPLLPLVNSNQLYNELDDGKEDDQEFIYLDTFNKEVRELNKKRHDIIIKQREQDMENKRLEEISYHRIKKKRKKYGY